MFLLCFCNDNQLNVKQFNEHEQLLYGKDVNINYLYILFCLKSAFACKYISHNIKIDDALSSEIQKNKSKITKQACESQGLES